MPVLAAADRQGAPLRRGGRVAHRQLVLERGDARARQPGRAARVRLRAADERQRGLAVHRPSSTVQPKPEPADWTTLEVPKLEAEVPRGGRRRASSRCCSASVAELVPVEGRPAQDGDVGRRRPRRRRRLGPARLRRRARRRSGSSRRSRTASAACSPARAARSRASSATARAARRRSRSRSCTERVLPPLDDELAQAASEFDTLDELRADIEGASARAARGRGRRAVPRRRRRRARAGVERRAAPARSSRCARASC